MKKRASASLNLEFNDPYAIAVLVFKLKSSVPLGYESKFRLPHAKILNSRGCGLSVASLLSLLNKTPDKSKIVKIYFSQESTLSVLTNFLGLGSWSKFTTELKSFVTDIPKGVPEDYVGTRHAYYQQFYRDWEQLINEAILKQENEQREELGKIGSTRSSDFLQPFIEMLDDAPIFVGQARKRSLHIFESSLVNRVKPLAIIGTAGLGKTNFAHQLITSSAATNLFGDQRIFISCESLTSVEFLCASILGAMNINSKISQMGAVSEDVVILALKNHTSKFLITLDNFESLYEHCVSTIGSFVSRLQRHCLLVITMRSEIIPAEMDWDWHPVDSLSEDEAVEIFNYHSNYLFEGNPLIQKLVESLDYIPLAIELMAKRAKGFVDLEDLEEAWQVKKLDLLKIRGYGNSKKHNLAYSISLSFRSQLISGSDRELLAVLSYLPAPVERRVLFRLNEENFDRLDRLKAVGLVVDTKDGNVKVLSPIREFVKAQSLNCEEELKRITRHYLEMIGTDMDPSLGMYFGAIDKCWENVLFSLDWNKRSKIGVIAICRSFNFVISRRITGCYHALIQDALILADTEGWDYIYAHGQIIYGWVLKFEGQNQKAIKHFLIGQKRAWDIDHHGLTGRGFIEAAKCFYLHGSTMLARKFTKWAWICARIDENHYDEVIALSFLGRIEFSSGKLRSSKVFLGRAIQKAEAHGLTCHTDAIICLVDHAILTGDLTEASKLVDEAIDIAVSCYDDPQVANAMRYRAFLYYLEGRYPWAREVLSEVMSESKEQGYLGVMADCLLTLGKIEYEEDNFEESHQLLNKACDGYEAISDWWGQSASCSLLGDIYFALRRYSDAVEAYSQAVSMYRDGGNATFEAENLIKLGQVKANGGFGFDVARESMDKALEIYIKLGVPLKIGEAYATLATLHFLRHDLREGTRCYLEARRAWKEAGEDGLYSMEELDSTPVKVYNQVYQMAEIEAHLDYILDKNN
ncbi:NB-ARC domain-containing protein [Dyadobacter jiangsuensis]